MAVMWWGEWARGQELANDQIRSKFLKKCKKLQIAPLILLNALPLLRRVPVCRSIHCQYFLGQMHIAHHLPCEDLHCSTLTYLKLSALQPGRRRRRQQWEPVEKPASTPSAPFLFPFSSFALFFNFVARELRHRQDCSARPDLSSPRVRQVAAGDGWCLWAGACTKKTTQHILFQKPLSNIFTELNNE